jgi:hypothetical protein
MSGTISINSNDLLNAIKPQLLQMPEITQQPYSYTIYTDGTTVYAKNGKTGQIDFSGTDVASIFNNVVNSIDTGGLIYVKKGTYDFNGATIYIPKYISIIGEGAYTTTLSNVSLYFDGSSLGWAESVVIARLGFMNGNRYSIKFYKMSHSVVEECVFNRPTFYPGIPHIILDQSVSMKIIKNGFEAYNLQSILIHGDTNAPIPVHYIAFNDFGTSDGTYQWQNIYDIASIYIDHYTQSHNVIALNDNWRKAPFLYSKAPYNILIGNQGGGSEETTYIYFEWGYNIVVANELYTSGTTSSARVAVDVGPSVWMGNYIEFKGGVGVKLNNSLFIGNVLRYQNSSGSPLMIDDQGNNIVAYNTFSALSGATMQFNFKSTSTVMNNKGYNPQPIATLNISANTATTIGPYPYPVQVILSQPSNADSIAITRGSVQTSLPISNTYCLYPGDSITITEGSSPQTAYVIPQ